MNLEEAALGSPPGLVETLIFHNAGVRWKSAKGEYRMGMFTMLIKMRRARIVVLFVSLLLIFGLVSYPRSADTRLKQLYSIGLGGVTGTTNNTVLVFGRYVLVAPFAPTKGITETGDLNLSELDNSVLYLIDVKKPAEPPITKSLTGWNASDRSRTVFFPSRVAYDANSRNVYVRGVRFEQKDDEVTPIDVIAYVNLHQDAGGNPVFDSNVISFDIPTTSAKRAGNAPLYFAVSGGGDLLVFTNGASVFSYNLIEGYVQELGIVGPDEYGANDVISYLDVDPATNVVTICRNRNIEIDGDPVTTTSELSFYRLGRFGTFQFLTRVEPDGFPGASALSAGSNVAILSDPGREGWEFASFVATDGSLCLVDLHEGDTTTARQLNTFPELAQSGANSPSPVLVNYDSANRTIGIVKPGYSIQISRPSNGRGRISRPSNIHIMTGEPVLAMAKLTKKNKVASVNSFVDAFKDEGGLSNFVNGDTSQWLVATYSGKLYSVNLGDDLSNSTLGFVGLIGSNVDRIDYYADRSSLVGISSFTMDPDGFQMKSQGSLVVVKIAQSSDALVQSFLPTAYTLVKQAPSIRRPSNIRR